jgi:hypothetical protein
VPCLCVRLSDLPFAFAIPTSSCSCAGAIGAGISSGVGLIKEAALGLDKWDGPAVQGVMLSTPLPFRSFALSALPAIAAPIRPLALAHP